MRSTPGTSSRAHLRAACERVSIAAMEIGSGASWSDTSVLLLLTAGCSRLAGIERKDVLEIAARVRILRYAAVTLANSLGERPNVRLNAALNALSDS